MCGGIAKSPKHGEATTYTEIKSPTLVRSLTFYRGCLGLPTNCHVFTIGDISNTDVVSIDDKKLLPSFFTPTWGYDKIRAKWDTL